MGKNMPGNTGDQGRAADNVREDDPHPASYFKQDELQRLQDLCLSSMAENVIYHDREMKIRWANRAACDFFGLPLEKIVGKQCYVLLGRRREECRECPVIKTMQDHRYHQNILKFSEGKTMLINAHPVWDAGSFAGVVEVALDITERTRIEAELRKAKDESEAASEAKTRFLANISHELRTPLNVILGMVNLISETSQSREQKEYLDMIGSSASFLLTLVNDLLDLSKIEAGGAELSQDTFNLALEVKKTVSSLDLQAREKGIRLSCSIGEDVPGVVIGDAAKLQQVLVNLTGNGIKFTEQGEVSVSLKLERKEEGTTGDVATVFFSVSDTGIGIPADKVERIFEDYTQADDYYASKYEGTGLGLPIVKNLVELMGGSIGVESLQNKGSTFYFTIPFLLPDATEEKAGPSPAVEDSGLPSAGTGDATGKQPAGDKEEGLEILLAEDKYLNQKLVTILLEKKGHRVITAKTGREALDKFRLHKFDLILMDIHMPEMDGLEAAARIRAAEERGKDIPIVAMTAYAMQEDRERCLQAGMDYYISKPFQAEKLYDILEKIREGRQ